MPTQSRSRVHRGMRSQKVVARWYEENGWPFAESTGSGRSGVDVTGMPGLAVEVKARSKLEPQAWLRQADREEGLPFVVFRLNGVGEANVHHWGVMMTVEHHTRLLREAGYGDPLEDADEFDQEPDHRHDEERAQRHPEEGHDPLTDRRLNGEELLHPVSETSPHVQKPNRK